jgi:hypothetical protein
LEENGVGTPIFIVWRGKCSFVKKVRNMEKIGVAVGFIIDDSEEDISNVVLTDDGTGGGIRIPSMLIGKEHGKILLDFLDRALEKEKKSMIVAASFFMSSPDNRVEYDFWYTSSNDRALDFLSDFEEMDKKLGKSVLITPHFVFWKCVGCEQSYLDNDCYGGGKYCAMEPSNHHLSGRDIIQEDLRQKCLYKLTYEDGKNRGVWWKYMSKAHEVCGSAIDETCSK